MTLKLMKVLFVFFVSIFFAYGLTLSAEVLPAPSYINASDGTRTDGVALSWATVSGASHYKIARSTSSSGAGALYGGWYAGTSFVDSSVALGVTYYYWIQAARSSSGSDASLFSSYNSGYRAGVPLPAPSYINASDGTRTDGVAVSWASVSGATHYKIARSTSSSGVGALYGDWYAGTSFVDRSTTSGLTYYYWVQAARSSSGSDASGFSPYNIGYRANTILPSPSYINASDGTRTDGVAVSWASVSGATHYRIARATSSSGVGVIYGDWYSGTSFIDTSAIAGVTYSYWVQAARSSSGSDASGFSPYNTGFRSLGVLPAPSHINASDGTSSDGVALNWASVAGATHYKIARSTSFSGAGAVYSSWYAGISLLDTTATAETTYYYWVQAASSSSGSRASSFSSYNTGYRVSAVLPAPSYINASDGTSSDGVVLTWASVSGATHYKIVRSTSPSADAEIIYGSWYAGTSFFDTSAIAGTIYYYWVRASRSSIGDGASGFSLSNSGYKQSSIPDGMVRIPVGTNSGTDDFGAYSLTVDSFCMDETEVTKAQWDEVYDWAINHGYSFDNSGLGKASNHPVQTVNWYDCVTWCNARSEMDGRTPCYNLSDWSCNTDANGYRLPTSEEWEYAARGGLRSKRFPWVGDTVTHNQANYYSSSEFSYDISVTRGYHPDYDNGEGSYTSPVGIFAPNGYGLYDMSGNVWEWSNTTFGESGYVRGGSGDNNASVLRCASVTWGSLTIRSVHFGFRTIRR